MSFSENSPFNHKEIGQCGLEKGCGLLVLGAKNKADEIEFKPPANRLLMAGTTLIVMGAVEQIARAQESF